MTIKELKEFYNIYYNINHPITNKNRERLIYLKNKFYTIVENDLGLFYSVKITSTALYEKVYAFVENKTIDEILSDE